MANSAQQNIVILTGAGISKESGLKTFRDADGIWAQYRLEDVATPDAFARNQETMSTGVVRLQEGCVLLRVEHQVPLGHGEEGLASVSVIVGDGVTARLQGILLGRVSGG